MPPVRQTQQPTYQFRRVQFHLVVRVPILHKYLRMYIQWLVDNSGNDGWKKCKVDGEAKG
ncbi:hypothetical protein MTR_4g119470 [Medicago truncatula]|uniref:Uncharacterized protein n=1 Tax=Medicago truncatula TaxID=3880 RepID=G7JKC0_MEDTR|nr:hypothetical protein MTR_4g119470 [Medicago truncatula]